MILQEYEFEVVHRAGEKHQNADSLSRQPLPSDLDPTGARLDGEGSVGPAAGSAAASSPPGASSSRGGGGHAALAVMAAATHEACCNDPAYISSLVSAAAAQQLGNAEPSFIDGSPHPILTSSRATAPRCWTSGSKSWGGMSRRPSRPGISCTGAQQAGSTRPCTRRAGPLKGEPLSSQSA
jgi:hypothetical protein